MNPIVFIVGGLITWRIAHIIAKEIGPLAVFARLRAYLASKQKTTGGLYDMISCVSCLSMYTGALTALALAGGVLEFFMYTLSFSAIATLIEVLTTQKDIT